LPIDEVLLIGACGDGLTPSEALAVFCSYLQHRSDTGDLAKSTVTKACQIAGLMTAYIEAAFGVVDIRAVRRDELTAFISSPPLGAELREPSGHTHGNRRWGCDRFFEALRALNLFDGDPLLDEGRIRRPSNKTRPLRSEEMRICRELGPRSAEDPLTRTTMAIAEAGADPGENAAVCPSDLRLDERLVWLCGGDRRHSRWGRLTPEGCVALKRWLRQYPCEPLASINYQGKSEIPSANATSTIDGRLRKALNRSGLGDDPELGPASITFCAGARVFDATGDLVAAAHAQGLRSVDRMREILGLDTTWCDIPPSHREFVW
jgi:integrase